MTRDILLRKTIPTFENKGEIIGVYTPAKIKDIYGYQYLIKQPPKEIQACYHFEAKANTDDIGLARANSILITSKEKFEVGDIFVIKGAEFAVADRVIENDTMGLYHHHCENIFNYYKDFIVDTEEQANKILGNNSLRYILTIESDFTILPSHFEVKKDPLKYVVARIQSSHPISLPRQNKDGVLEQWKKDFVMFYAVNLDTNELLDFANLLKKQKDFGITKFPCWVADNRYNKEFDLQANTHKMEVEINYMIVGTQAKDLAPKIKEAFVKFLS